MKKILQLSILFVLFSFVDANSQTPDWVWARNAQSTNTGEGYSIAADQADNVFIAGEFTPNITFGSYTLTSFGGVFLAKYDPAGNVKWAKCNLGGLATGWSVTTDGAGNSFVTGQFSASASFSSHIVSSLGGQDVFLVKYDSSGNALWAKSAGGAANDIGRGVATDASGNIYVTGPFTSPSLTIGSFTLPLVGTSGIFLAKYDASGNVLWARSSGGISSSQAYGFGVATDAFGNVFITGEFGPDSVSFGSDTLVGAAGTNDVFIVKYDSSGNVLWAKSAGGTTGVAISYSVTTDASNNVCLTGYFKPSVTFGSTTLIAGSGDNAFLAKYDPSGNVLWAKNIGSSSGTTRGYNVATDKLSNKIYVTGSFSTPTLNIDTTITIVRPAGFIDPMFVAGYDSTGHAFFAKALPSGGDDQNAVAVGPGGCVYIGGDFEQTIMVLGSDTLVSPTGTENVFVAKLCDISTVANFTCSDTVFCNESGQCINFFDHSTGSPTSWHWTFTGANPDTSSLQNPDSICYSTPGTYPVQLIVSNGSTTDTLTVSPLIIFGTSVAQPTITIRGGDTLVSSHGSTYQWYLNGNVIAGATDSFYVEHQSGTYSVQISDVTGGCHALSSGVAVGIIELSGGGGISIFPNPFSNELTVTASPPTPLQGRGEELEITLFDITSRMLLHRSFVNSATINTEQLAKGVYLYELKNKNGVIGNGKVVKE